MYSGLLWQQCEVDRACVGSRMPESRKQAATLSRGVLCYVGWSLVMWVL